LSLFVRYLEKVSIYSLFTRYFSGMKKNKKGAKLISIIKQILCFFIDGTNLVLRRFEEVKDDKGYRGVIEEKGEEMCSSHTMKRFFGKFHYFMMWNFRRILGILFIWRLKIEKPSVIILSLDTMVMDNDDAKKREGVLPTYKKVRGFQPLQLSWGCYIIDAV